MFTKEDIEFNRSGLPGDRLNYEKQQDCLYNIAIDIINKLNITSLSKIVIKDINLYEAENGRAVFDIQSGILSSIIELSRVVFCQFNNNQNVENKNKAVATIWHEFYHVYDRENIYKVFKDAQFKTAEMPYFEIGINYWSEFFAWNKTKKIHISHYSLEEFDSVYEALKFHDPDKNIIHRFFYIISQIIAYLFDENFITQLNNTKCYTYIEKAASYIDLIKELNDIMSVYPQNINENTFINLGKVYCKLIEDLFHYKINFDKDNMTFTKYTLEDLLNTGCVF